VTKRSFRDRFFTPKVARAITSPSGILLAGAGASAAILLGLPVAAILGIGALAWGGRVAAAVPRNASPQNIDPFALQDPWRSFVRSAQDAQRKFNDAVNNAQKGPLRDRLTEIGGRLGDAVTECWRVARQGNALADARSQLDTSDTERELAGLDRSSASYDKTAEALQAQLASAQRLETTINDARDRLRLLDARMDEAVARAIELSVQGSDVEHAARDFDVFDQSTAPVEQY